MPSVRFNDDSLEQVREIKTSSSMSEEEHRRLYIQPYESERIRIEAHRLATAIRRCHQMDSDNPISYTNCFAAVFETCVVKNKNQQQNDAETMRRLCHWIHAGPNRRGLEKYSMDFLQQEQTKNKKRHVQTILRLQETMWDCGMSPEDVARSLARTSLRSSKRDQRFAQTMAIADTACVKLDMEIKNFSKKERKEKDEEEEEQEMHRKGNRKFKLLASQMGDDDSLRRAGKIHRAKKSRKVLAQ